MKQAQETGDFYPTRRAGEAPPEHVIGGGFKPDLSDTPDLPESGVTLKHVRETVRGILTALKGTATLLAVAVSAMLMAESLTGTEGELLDNLPGDSTVLLDAPAVKKLLEGKVSYLRTAPAAPSNNANCYGYRGTLKALGVTGSAALVRRLSILTRASGNQNVDVPLWARIVRKDAGAWKVVAQAKEPRKWSDVSAGSELSWEMAPVAGASLPGTSDAIAIVWVNSETAAANVSNGPVSFQTIDLSGGLQSALPTNANINTSLAAWSPRITLEYTEAYVIDSALSATSTNPVQNKVLYSALKTKQEQDYTTARMSISATPYDWYNDVLIDGANRLVFYNTNVESMLLQSKGEEGSISWYTGAGIVTHKLGGGHTEVWRGNVGFGEQDTFFGPRKVADGEGQFYKGYPRLHNHGQDIHEVSGFSRDSRDDETVWSHRLLLPWDLAKANDTSYLMAGVVWQSERLAALGGDTTFVQPLLPKNTGATASVLPQAIPCFENSPIFWNGHLIWEGTYAPKQIKMPWSRVADGAEAELALKSDIPSIDSTFTEPVKIQNGMGTGSLWIGGDVNAGTLTNNKRRLARIVVPTFEDVTKSATLLGFDSSGDSDLNVANRAYDAVSFGGSKKISNSTSPMALSFCVTKARGSTAAGDKIYPLEMDASEARFNVRPNYNGVPLATMNDLEAKDDEGETGWVSPGDWTLAVAPAEEYAVIDSSVVVWTNNVQQVIGTAQTSTFSAAAKMVSLEMLDVAQPAPTVSFACDGATITRGDNAQSALVTAEAEGLYRVSATDDSGRMRTAYLSIRAKEKSTKVENAYLADVPGTARAAANDAMLAALQQRDTSVTVQSGITAAVATGDKCFDASGAPLATAPLAPRFFCCVDPSRTWGPDAVAVAPHFAVTAAHWSPAQTKAATFRTPDGATATVTGTWGISLVEWARQQGYSESEIRDADLADIWVWQFDNGTIPEACIPAVLDRSAWEHYYRSDLTGVACYAVTQNGYLSFGQLLHPDGGAYSIGSFTPERTRADLLATLSPPACALIYGGDSGRPVMMIHEGEPVFLSTFWTAGSGPSMIKACEVLDELIKTRSGGTESLKRISAP